MALLVGGVVPPIGRVGTGLGPLRLRQNCFRAQEGVTLPPVPELTRIILDQQHRRHERESAPPQKLA